MATLVWDQIGERKYETGVDRGVLYLHDGTSVAWNGLIGVEETTSSEIKSYFLDGVKYLETLSPRDFEGKLKAYTYPDEFDSVNGLAEIAPGLFYHDQPSKSFDMSYRTKIGNDSDGLEYGYKIHILYNILANPDNAAFETLSDSGKPAEFGWTLTGTPLKISKYKPTVHISIDSTKVSSDLLAALEKILYGSDTANPHLPSITEIAELFGYLGALIIVDNGDGTWTAIDEADVFITMLNETTFQIDNADVTIIDASTYTISSTNA